MTDNRVSEKFGVPLPTVSVKGLEARIRAGKYLDDASRSDRSRSARTLENMTAVSQAIKDNP